MENPEEPAADGPPAKWSARKLAPVLLLLAFVLMAVSTLAWFKLCGARPGKTDLWFALFSLLALGQLVAGIAAGIACIVAARPHPPERSKLLFGSVLGFLIALGAPVGWVLGMLVDALGSAGMPGRPLRVRGRQLHASLREGSDWAEGERPDPRGLDEPTRRALEALWLHDAQMEHASVPAFARISWLLAAVGAPAELTEWTHRAALEEIKHTRRCFALAAGYGDRSHSVEAIPELLLGGLDCPADPLVTLAVESLSDGCQLEDFNADVAAECARVCEEPTTRAVLEQIAIEERSHAELSWALLGWLTRERGSHVRGAIEKALADLARYPRPRAVSREQRRLVERADPDKLRAHGRIPDQRWAALWDARLVQTRARVARLLYAPARLSAAPELARAGDAAPGPRPRPRCRERRA